MLFDCFGSAATDQLEQVADLSMGLNRMTKCLSFENAITILPPNAPLCVSHANERSVMTVSSRHQGGAHILMADGAVVFITDSVAAGNGRRAVVHKDGTAALDNVKGSKSPFGLWGALGTRASKDSVEAQLNR